MNLSKTAIYNPPESIRFRDRVLFVDTETTEDTKEIISVQLRIDGENIILTPPIDIERIRKLWESAAAVVFHNAPYDMGVLSTLRGNSYQWRKDLNKREVDWDTGEVGTFTYCKMWLFGSTYKVKRLSGTHNFIRVDGKGTPVLDTLKLYEIFIEKKDLSLKKLAPKYLGREMIPYSPENAKTTAYQVQDVEALDGIYCHFMHEMLTIDDVKDYRPEDWMKVDSTASCAKTATLKVFPKINEWRKENNEETKKFGLYNSLETAYMGGLTCAMYHGTVKGVSVNDIKGSYDAVINHENTDQFNKYTWRQIEPPEYLADNNDPILCKVWTNVVMKHMEDSLKIFKISGEDEGKDVTYWSYDILTLKNLFPDADIRILEAYRPVSLCEVTESLASKWNKGKADAEKKYGKDHPLRTYYKTMSNASYGICAQRKHGQTPFTNMVKAGIIASRARLTLAKMIKCSREMGCDWLYSDTDSVIVRLNGVDPGELEVALNKAIYPYQCECEFVGDIRVISLKRYWGYNGKDMEGNEIPDKTRVHGRGRYNISEDDLKRMLSGEKITDELLVKQYAATTEITMKMVERVNPKITNPHPFMFETNIPKGIPKQTWFDEDWAVHLDSKGTSPENACFEDEFEREFPTFEYWDAALKHYKEHKGSKLMNTLLEQNEPDDDAMTEVLFGEL